MMFIESPIYSALRNQVLYNNNNGTLCYLSIKYHIVSATHAVPIHHIFIEGRHDYKKVKDYKVTKKLNPCVITSIVVK